MKTRSSTDSSDYGRSAAQLAAAIAIAGALTYLFFALASHALDREEYGRIVVLWSVMFVAISVLFRPVEQLLSRTIAELEIQGRPTAHAVRVGVSIQATVAMVFAVAAIALRGPIEDSLFDGESIYFWALVASVLGFSASFFARGFLAGSGRFGLYSWLLLVDAVARTSFALAVSVGIAAGADPLVVGIAVAPALSLAVIPFASRSPRVTQAVAPRSDPTSDFTLAQGGSFAAAIFVVMLAEQVFLNAGPLYANAELGTAAAGFIFNVLMVVRAPVVLFQGAATALLPHLTRILATGQAGSADRFDASIRTTLVAIAAFALVVTGVVVAAGPPLMEVAFGDKFTYERTDLAIVAVGMGFYLAATTLNQAVLAQGRARHAAISWAIAAGAMLAWYVVPAFEPFRRIETGFTGAAALLALTLWTVLHRGDHSNAGALEPDSPREREARLAAAE